MGEVGGQPVVRRGVGILRREILAVADGSAAVHVEVLHLIAGLQLLLLVAGNHVSPCGNGVAQGVDGVGLHFAVVAVGQHDDVVHLRLIGRLVVAVVGVIDVVAVLVGVHHAEALLVGLGNEREVDALASSVGLRLCVGQRAGEHVAAALVHQSGDELLHEVLLRVYEGRCHPLPWCQHLAAHQVEQAVLLVVSAGYLDHASCCQGAAAGHECRVADGLDGYGRTNEHIGLHTHIEVGIGSHHRNAGIGRDILVGRHGVGKGALARTGEDDINARVEHTGGVAYLTVSGTDSHT